MVAVAALRGEGRRPAGWGGEEDAGPRGGGGAGEQTATAARRGSPGAGSGAR